MLTSSNILNCESAPERYVVVILTLKATEIDLIRESGNQILAEKRGL